VEVRIYQQRIQNADKLRQRLVAVWKDLEQHIVDTAIDQWHRHLTACIKAKGGHF